MTPSTSFLKSPSIGIFALLAACSISLSACSNDEDAPQPTETTNASSSADTTEPTSEHVVTGTETVAEHATAQEANVKQYIRQGPSSDYYLFRNASDDSWCIFEIDSKTLDCGVYKHSIQIGDAPLPICPNFDALSYLAFPGHVDSTDVIPYDLVELQPGTTPCATVTIETPMWVIAPTMAESISMKFTDTLALPEGEYLQLSANTTCESLTGGGIRCTQDGEEIEVKKANAQPV